MAPGIGWSGQSSLMVSMGKPSVMTARRGAKQAYRFTLDPTPAQERALRSHAGSARFAWNWGLAKCRERYAAERKWYSGAELHKLWNQAKKGHRKGRQPGFPRFKKKGKCRDSFRLTGALRCGESAVILPRLGTVRTHEPTRKLARRLADGSARILAAGYETVVANQHSTATVRMTGSRAAGRPS
jgi:putative transposase